MALLRFHNGNGSKSGKFSRKTLRPTNRRAVFDKRRFKAKNPLRY